MRRLHGLIRFGLQARITILTVLALLLMFGIMGYITLRNQTASMEVMLQQRVTLAQTAAAYVDDYVGNMLLELGAAAEYPGFALSDDDLEHEQHALADLYRQGMFYAVFITDTRGIVLAVEPQSLRAQLAGADFSRQPHVRRALDTGEPQVSGVITVMAVPGPLVSLLVPVKNAPGEVIGLIGGALDPASPTVSGFIAPMALGQTGHAQLVDGQGMVIASTKPDRMGKPDEHLDLTLSLLQRGEPTVSPNALVTKEGKDIYEVIAFAPIPRFGWGVTIEQERAETLAPLIRARDQIMQTAIVALAIAVLFVWLTTRQVTRPVLALTASARRISAGDLGTPLPELGKDEVGQLGRSLEAMRQKLAAWGEELETAVQERTRELSVLHAIDRAAAQSLDLEEILNDSLDKVLELFAVQSGAVYLLREPGGPLILTAQRGLAPAFLDRFSRIELGQECAGRAAATGCMVNALEMDERAALCQTSEALLGQDCFAVFPLTSRGQVQGVMELWAPRWRRITAEEAQLLVTIGHHLGSVVENGRLYQAERRLATQLALVADIARRVSSILDADALLQETAVALQQAFDHYDIILFLVDQPAGELTLKARAGSFECPFSQEKPVWKTGDEGIIDWVARHGRTLLVNDVSREPRYRAFLPGTRSELCVPIKDGERVVAGINVESDCLDAFDEADVVALEILADELAVALRNAWLFRERQRAEEELLQRFEQQQAIYRLTETVGRAETLEEIYAEALDSLQRTLKPDRAAILLLDPDGVMRFKSWRGLSADYRAAVEGHSPWSPGETNPQPVLISNVEDEPGLGALRAVILREGIRAMVFIPIAFQGRLRGKFMLYYDMPHPFGAEETRLAQTIAGHVAFAIHRASLFDQLEHRVHELSTLFDVGKMITATLRIEDVQRFVVHAAAQAAHAEGSYLFLWDEREERLVVSALVGFLEKNVGRIKYRMGEGLAGWVFLEGRTANAPNLVADPRWKHEAEYEVHLTSGRALNAVVVPLRCGDKTLGVLGVVNKIGAPAFTENDQSLLTALAGQVAIAIENARLYEDVRGLSLAAVRSLVTAIDARDPYTRGHSENVTALAVQLAREMGWSGADLEMLEFAALLHDVGKIAVPDAVLRKVEPLTADEWDVIRLHPYHSGQIVKPVEPLQRIVSWVYHHQERWDGTGYPDGLKGEAIPLAARIIAVADAWNAMTTNRPYRKALSVAKALVKLERNAGTQFDPAVVEAFLRGYRSGSIVLA